MGLSPVLADANIHLERNRELGNALHLLLHGMSCRIEIGFVYQFHHLLMEFSAIENVIIPQMIRGLSRQEATQRATDLLGY